jgi:hypothetical protein
MMRIRNGALVTDDQLDLLNKKILKLLTELDFEIILNSEAIDAKVYSGLHLLGDVFKQRIEKVRGLQV